MSSLYHRAGIVEVGTGTKRCVARYAVLWLGPLGIAWRGDGTGLGSDLPQLSVRLE
jgi:hypothetical protein